MNWEKLRSPKRATFIVENKGNLLKMTWSHFKLNIMNETFSFLEF